jgi:hypothetical protein
MRTNSIDNKQLDFQSKGQRMKRIIRSNAFRFGGHLHPTSKLPKVVDIYDGAVFALLNQTANTLVPEEDATNSASLLCILKQQPSVVPYLIVLSGIAFLAMTLIWVMNGRIEEVGLRSDVSSLIEAEKALKTAQQNTVVTRIPVQRSLTDVRVLKAPVVITAGDMQVVLSFMSEHDGISGKIIPKHQLTEMDDMKFQNKQMKKAQVVHSYRVVDMLFKE